MTSMDHIRKQKLTQSAERIKILPTSILKNSMKSLQLKQKILNSKAPHELRRDICDNKLYSSKLLFWFYCFASIEANKRRTV